MLMPMGVTLCYIASNRSQNLAFANQRDGRIGDYLLKMCVVSRGGHGSSGCPPGAKPRRVDDRWHGASKKHTWPPRKMQQVYVWNDDG